MRTLGWQIESISLICLECLANIEREDGSLSFSPEDLETSQTFQCVVCDRKSKLPRSLRKIIKDMARVQV